MTDAKQDKIYVGNGKVIETESGFSFLSYNLSPEDIEKINNYAIKNDGWCKLNIAKRKEQSPRGYTHYGTINTWKPTKAPSEIVANNNAQEPIVIDGQEVPF